jgi:hypothetical protein
MGVSASSEPLVCEVHKTNLRDCKAQLGLSARDPYPRSYNGECDDVEILLKKCFAFELCNKRGDARRFYDLSCPRTERVEANKALQKCLGKVDQFKASLPVPTKPKYDMESRAG